MGSRLLFGFVYGRGFLGRRGNSFLGWFIRYIWIVESMAREMIESSPQAIRIAARISRGPIIPFFINGSAQNAERPRIMKNIQIDSDRIILLNWIALSSASLVINPTPDVRIPARAWIIFSHHHA